ncbi:hypothetical protein D3C71_665110 [compost metagenome]
MFHQKARKHLLTSGILFLGMIALFSCADSNAEVKQTPKKKKTELAETDQTNQEETDALLDNYIEQEWVEIEDPDFIKLLLDEEAKTGKKRTIDYKNHSIYFPNKGDSYRVRFTIRAKEDLNNDSISDYIVYRTSEGMLGGNANTNEMLLYYLMGPNNTILQQHEIVMSAPFSYNIFEKIRYNNSKLTACVIQNYRTYMPADAEDLKSTNLSFVYKDSNLYEESYLNECALAKWKNKRLFNSASEVRRTIEMHNYTELVYEKFATEEFEFSAEFSGCDNLNLVVEGVFKYSGKDPKYLAEKRAHFLEYLKTNTSLTKEFEIIQNYLLTHELSDKLIELDNFSFNLYSSQEKGKTTFRLILDQKKNPKQSENWEITIRQ